MSYSIAHIVHLFCAIVFVGGVFFEVLVLSAVHGKQVSRSARHEVMPVIGKRVKNFMPWVVVVLFLSGVLMAMRYGAVLSHPFSSAFAWQLSLKILLAFSVFVHFLIAIVKMKHKTLTKAWSRYIHMSVFVHMIFIVFLAKSMFYFNW